MAKTYVSIRRIVQPIYQRYRNVFRGPRSSHDENLEMSQMLIDIKRLDTNADNLNNSVYDNVRIFVGQRDPEAANIHDENEDGKYYIFDDVQVEFYGDSATPDYVQIDTLDTMSSKISRMNHKIRLMELKREMNL